MRTGKSSAFILHLLAFASAKLRRLRFLRPLPPLDTSSLPSPYFILSKSRDEGPSALRDPCIEEAQKAASSKATPAPPLPPPELTKDGKKLTKKEFKKVCLPSPPSTRACRLTLPRVRAHRQRTRLPALDGSTSPRPPSPTFRGYTARWRRSGCTSSSTRSSSTAKSPARARASRASPSTLRFVSSPVAPSTPFTSPFLRRLTALCVVADRHDPPDGHAVRRRTPGQPPAREPEAHARR